MGDAIKLFTKERYFPLVSNYLIYYFYPVINILLGTAVAQWLRCCATNRKVAGSIPDGVI